MDEEDLLIPKQDCSFSFNSNGGIDHNMIVSWHNLSVTVNSEFTAKQMNDKLELNRKHTKQVLYEQSGYVASGEALYIMGASGAGKTTLLNCLWGKIKYYGQVLLNKSLEITDDNFGKFGAYVTQDDVLFPSLTCLETFVFACRLKLNLSNKEAHEKAQKLIKELGLTKWQDTLVGNQLIRGMSGGEKKRTAIGVELITDPSVILLDEPTSGLDSHNAQKIVKVLDKQAQLGKVVIATIHQPNSDTFKWFDKLLLLMEGHAIYHGKASNAARYFGDIGYAWPDNYNPPDYFLRVFSRDKSEKETK